METFNKLAGISVFLIHLFLAQVVSSQVTVSSENFNTNFGTWIDGGPNCSLRTDNRPNNTQSVRLRNDSSSSFVSSPNLDITSYASVSFSFDYEARSMETGESFRVQYSSNGGSSWSTLATYVGGTDFNNGIDYAPTITINSSAYTFAVNSRFRVIINNASDNNDRIYIDNVLVQGFSTPAYCAFNGTDDSYEYIQRVQLNTINNPSGAGTPTTGYTDFTAISTSLNATSTYTIFITQFGGYTEGYAAWIDYNQDGDFSDAGEQVWTQAPTAAGVVSGSFIVPPTALAGNTRMRVAMSYNTNPPNPPCGTFTYGEVEDYTVNIVPAVPTPEMNIQGNAITIIDAFNPPSLADDTDFGNVDVVAGTNVNTFTIQNTGAGTLNLTGASPYVVIGGAHPGDFTVTAIPANTIAASGSTTFNITFNPSALGLRTATVSIANNDADENPYNFNIQGTGTTSLPEMDVLGNATSIPDGSPTPSLANDTDFGNVDVTSGTNANTFTISNVGGGTLNLTNPSPYVTITGTHAADFTLTATPVGTIPASNATPFTITFNPSALGLRTAIVTIANDDADENPYNFNIQGTGTDICGGYVTVFPYTQDFESGVGTWTQDTGDNFDWSNTTGTTPTGSTGPNQAKDGVSYMFTEANGNNNNTANLITPCFDLTGTTNPRVTLFVHMYGANTGTINLNLSTDNGLTYPTTLWTNTGEIQNNVVSAWIPVSVDLSAYVGQTVKFQIQGIVGNGDNSDLAIDAFSVTDKPNPTTGPGGVVTDLSIWLKANDGLSYTDGQDVSLWEDQGLAGDAKASTAGVEPTYRDNVTSNINFNPVVEFDNPFVTFSTDPDYSYDNTSSEFLTSDYGMYTQEMFIVLIPDDTSITNSFGFMDVFCGDFRLTNNETDATGIGFGDYTGRISGEIICFALDVQSGGGDGYAVAEIGTGSSYDNTGIINTRNNSANTQQELYYNANNIETNQNDVVEYTSVNDARFWLGRSEGWEASLNARVAEVVSYKSRLNDVDLTQNRNRVQSYLAIKYGITLGTNGTSQDYVDSDGTVIWDQSANATYNYDVAGIGRDDASELNQKQSSSINNATDGTGPTQGILTMGLADIYDTNNQNIATNPTTFNDKEFLMWGNNGADLNLAAATVNVDMSAGIAGLSTPVTFTAMQRIWKVVENGGDIGTVKVSIPQNAVRNITPPGDYLMFISDFPIFDPTADYRVMTVNGSNLEAEYDFDGTKYITFGYAPQVEVVRSVYFDGAVDYIEVGDALDLNPASFTVSSWIKRAAGATNASILSKRDAAYTEGYDFRIDASGHVEMSWKNGSDQIIRSDVVIPVDEWHHVAVIYNAGTANLYIDGVLAKTESLTAPGSTTRSFNIAAAGKSTINSHFEGNIDEVRVWNTALSLDQLHYIMNQEIEENATFVNGRTIPQAITKNDVSTIPWTSLAGYYPMSIYTYTNTNDASGNSNQGALRNLDTVDFQTAPLPYESQANGAWTTDATWLNHNVQALPNTLSIVDGTTPINWNIVETNHNISIQDNATLGREREVLGLMVKSNEITVSGDTATGTGNGLTVTHYLELDGSIDLEGESQLIQSDDSDLDVTSSGTVERDQQGSADLFTYNYWAAPVGVSNTTSNNNNYTLPDVMRDGTNPATPAAITWLTSGYNGTSGAPVGIADYWIWKFANQLSDDYPSWQHVRSTGNLQAGEGFTMKGTTDTGGVITTMQNYVFNGKPHNGEINLTLSAGNDYLVGNPYASAIDANEFILDNISSSGGRAATNIIDGALYFWDHFAGSTHVLAEYQGGYATYTLIGGTVAISNDTRINNSGATGVKTPGRYIPVGQGFFVNSLAGGQVTFKNSQRTFRMESSGSSQFMRTSASNKNTTARTSSPEVDNRPKIKLMFDSPKGYHRQLLVGADPNCTDRPDIGYDALLTEDNKEDMYWLVYDKKYIIQAVDHFNTDRVLPLGIKIDQDGNATFRIDQLENISNSTQIYLHDKTLGIYTDLRDKDYEIFLATGEYTDRFEITFDANGTLGNNNFETSNLDVHFANSINSIIIVNPMNKELKTVEMFNLLGQQVYSKEINDNRSSIELKLNNALASGTYVIKLTNDNNYTTTKKVVVE